MHILIIHQAFASLDEPGGTRHHEFARMLVENGHKVTVIASPISYITGTYFRRLPTPVPDVEDKTGNPRILRASAYAAHHKSFIHRVLAFLSFMISSFWIGLGVKDVDVVWGTSPPIFQGITAWALARLKGAKFLFEVRDLWPQFAIAVGILKNPLLIMLAEGLERFLYAHADQIMVNSPGFIEPVIRRGARSVKLIPNGADPSMFDPNDDGAKFRQLYGLEDKFVVMYAGAHGMSNDLTVVLESAHLLANSRSIRLVLVGDGKEKTALQEQAKSLRLENILFLPSVSKSEIPAILAASDACIAILKQIDEYKTTYPNKVFDYMASGKPILLAIDGVIREVIESAGCGIFVTPGDSNELAKSILQLADHKNEAQAMGRRGRKYLEEHFSRETSAKTLIELLEGLVS